MDKDFATAKSSPASIRSLSDARPLYFLPDDPLAREVLIPAFQSADSVKCMVGFFASSVLVSLAPGLATFINRTRDKFQLVISPLLQPADQAALQDGVKSPEDIALDTLSDFAITEDLLQQHTLKCLSYLLRVGRIEIRIAIMKGALFHPKVWLFESTSGDVLAAHGSSNVTYAGLNKNIEQVAISKSWEDPSQSYVTNKLRLQFEQLWENNDDNCVVVSLPQAIKEQLLKSYTSEQPPTEEELIELYSRSKRIAEDSNSAYEPIAMPAHLFQIPPELRYQDGAFAHQGKAVDAWCDASFNGILEMATGSGKTITSMICAHRLYQHAKRLLIVVAAPYVPLIEQWYEEIRPFGLNVVNLTTLGGAKPRSSELQRIRRRMQTDHSEVEAVIVSHDTLCTAEFQREIARFTCSRLLIADEVHNLGSPSFIGSPPESFEYRLGLSATPVRQYDDEGTVALESFFGPVVFRYALEEAVGKCLVEYEYYVHPVALTNREMDAWYELSEKIRKNAWRNNGAKIDDRVMKLMRDRRLLLETAENKLLQLGALLDQENLKNLRHTLIYATDKAPEQLQAVNQMLLDRRVLFHQLTARETSDRAQTSRIIKMFQQGDIQILTAKRVLDEGVNIPQICRAYILASTTVERQWIQRRGRLLRTCKSIGKQFSIIHDFPVVPPHANGLDPDARSIVRSELHRAQEFARLAKNAGRPDGPLATIDKLVNVAYL